MKVNLISKEIVFLADKNLSVDIEFSPLDHFALGHFPLAMIFGFKDAINTERLKESLKTLLATNYELGAAIRITNDGRHLLHTGAGIDLVIQRCNEPMPDCNSVTQLPIEDYPLSHLPLSAQDLVEKKLPLFGIRVTHFSEGGCTFGVRLTHSHLDGGSILRLLVNLGKIYNNEIPDKPFIDRSRIIKLAPQEAERPSRSLPLIQSNDLSSDEISMTHSAPRVDKYVCRQIIFFTGVLEDYIKRVKDENKEISSSDIICGAAWKAWALSSAEDADKKSFLYRLFDLRSIKDFKLPANYQGNAALDRCIELTFGEVRSSSVATLAAFYKQQVKPLKLAEVIQDLGYLKRLHRSHTYSKDGNFTTFLRKFSFDILSNRGLFVNDMRRLNLDEVKFSSEALWYAAGQDYSLPGYIEISKIYDGTIFVRHHSLVDHAESFEYELRKLITN